MSDYSMKKRQEAAQPTDDEQAAATGRVCSGILEAVEGLPVDIVVGGLVNALGLVTLGMVEENPDFALREFLLHVHQGLVSCVVGNAELRGIELHVEPVTVQ